MKQIDTSIKMGDTKFYYWVSVLVANVESYEAHKLENIKLYESNQKKITFCAVRALCRGCESLKNFSKTSKTFRNFQSKLLPLMQTLAHCVAG